MNARQVTTTDTRRKRCINPQPLAAADLVDSLLTMETASVTAALSKSTLYRMAADGRLKLTKIGARCTRVRASDLRAFLASLG